MRNSLISLLLLLCVYLPMQAQYVDAAEDINAIHIQVSEQGGFYDEPITLKMYASDADVYYTIDGTRPSKKSKRYRTPIRITRTMPIRMVAYRNKQRSDIISHTYFIQEKPSKIPIISVAITPWLLFDKEKGLFKKGNNVIDSLWSKPGANFWSKKEVTANIEMYEPNGDCFFRSLVGFRIFGGMSRIFPQKSIAIVARNQYGESRIRHDIFGKEGLKKFKFLVLRNSGSDFSKSHFRDALMTGLVDDWDIEKQDYRASHLYINGEYWGIYNIREKINRYFLAGHHEVHKDSIDLLEHQRTRRRGSRLHYLRMIEFMEQNDLRIPRNYAWVQSQMDIENFMDYQIAQIYFDNQDAGGNIKYWRPKSEDGKWRWILYDTDWGFGLHQSDAYKNNSLDFHTKANGPAWPNPPWSTFILRKLLENKQFEQQFITRFCDRMNSSFASRTVQQKIESILATLRPEMDKHLERWEISPKTWARQINTMRTFGQERPNYVRMHLMEKFDTGAEVELDIDVTQGGRVVLNDNITIPSKQQFKGTYFEKTALKFKAISNYGYKFSHWEGIEQDMPYRDFNLHLRKKAYKIKAVFERYMHPLAGKIVINEISGNNKKTKDWLELYNYTEETVNLNNWVLTDRKNEFTLPDVTIAPNDYLLICEDSLRFFNQFKEAYNVIGRMGFGINKRREVLQLFTDNGALVDSMGYIVDPLDSTFVLSLLLPHLNNGDSENWEIRTGVGTPNAPNPFYVESRIKSQQELWMQIGAALAIIFVCVVLLLIKPNKE